jgi:hypothetical protein
LISPGVVIPSNDSVLFSPIVRVSHPATLTTEV